MRELVDATALVAAATLGALANWATDSGWIGAGVAGAIATGYVLILAPRIPDRARERQEAYDATPDGRLTRHH